MTETNPLPEVNVILEPPLPSVQVILEPPLPDIVVVVEPSLPEVLVMVEEAAQVLITIEPPLPEIKVDIFDEGLPGRNGLDGKDATDAGGAVYNHIHNEAPHPVYDDGPSFLLLYLNAKV